MEVESPPAYNEVTSNERRSRSTECVRHIGPPPPYSSQEQLMSALLQTDADGSSSTEFDLPPSYEEVIAGLSNVPPRPDDALHREGNRELLRVPSAPSAVGSESVNTRRSRSPTRRLIHITKPPGDEGYGFAFRDGLVSVVLPNSAAARAGLREGLKLIEVNRVNVEGQSREFMRRQITSLSQGVSLLIQDPVVWTQPSVSWLSFTLRKSAQGYGFAFRGVHISVVLPNSEAAQVGLCVGDSLLSINGVSTRGRDRAGLLELIGLHPDEVRVTINRRVPHLHAMQPARYILQRSPLTGYGFAFRGTRISALLPGSDAEQKGLRIGDKILEINGHVINGQDKNQLLGFINERRNEVALLVLPDVSPISNV